MFFCFLAVWVFFEEFGCMMLYDSDNIDRRPVLVVGEKCVKHAASPIAESP